MSFLGLQKKTKHSKLAKENITLIVTVILMVGFQNHPKKLKTFTN